MAETIEVKFPEILEVWEDMPHMSRAARVNTEVIGKALNSMQGSVRQLENHLATAKPGPEPEDLFIEVMEVSFY